MNRRSYLARLTEPDDDAFESAPGDRYFNRELSWLAFNRRVLEEACNPAHPLLERLRFLSISGSNLDEFFMVRVAGLKGQQLQEIERRTADGLTVGQQLAAVITAADELMASQQRVWADLREALDAEDIFVLRREAVDAETGEWLENHFRDQIFPTLTPRRSIRRIPFPSSPTRACRSSSTSCGFRTGSRSGNWSCFPPRPGGSSACLASRPGSSPSRPRSSASPR